EGQSPRLHEAPSPSTSTSRGFLIVGTCGDKSCVFEHAVQKHDFEDPTLRSVIGGKPLITKGLQKFKSFRGQLFVVAAVHQVQLQLDRGQPVQSRLRKKAASSADRLTPS